jgi:hypothetical protein
MAAFQGNSFGGDMVFGTYYPKGYLIATFNDGAAAHGAHGALTQHGFAQTRVWTGEEAIAQHDALAAQRNAEWQHGSSLQANNKLGLQDYMKAAHDGAFFVTLPVPDETMVEQARAALANYQPHMVHYYGSVGMIDLGAQSTTAPGITPTTAKVDEATSPPPASPDAAQRDPAW